MEVNIKKQLKVEFFQVEMSTDNAGSCSACETVQTKLVSAIQQVQKLFHQFGNEIIFKQKNIETIEEAQKENIIASPTIRVGHLDFYPKHLSDYNESREWHWNGQTFNELDKGTLIEVILKGYLAPYSEKKRQEISSYVQKHLKDGEQKKNCGCR